MKNGRGFTLIEIIMAVGIIALLAAISFTAINPNRRIGQANDALREAALAGVGKALELYVSDHASLPSGFMTANINIGHKVVLCSSAATLSCDGQTRACLVVDDTDFLTTYLGGDLPVDPAKNNTTDTGYYITRISGDAISFGACDAYQSANIQIATQVALAPYIVTCGDGDIGGAEVCDDGNTTTETQICNNDILETGNHCNADCSQEIVLTETCDDGPESCGDGAKQSGTFCNATCNGNYTVSEVCDYTGFACSEAPIAPHTGAVGCPSAPFCNADCSACVKTCPAPPA
ncbi:MAG: prepilin-type N-terminal cleavage/methylation domain-containing protein [Patescibacteria group bacterium]|jgi:prepilin-type N-terminal cleavage/methylation domain-containing protein